MITFGKLVRTTFKTNSTASSATSFPGSLLIYPKFLVQHCFQEPRPVDNFKTCKRIIFHKRNRLSIHFVIKQEVSTLIWQNFHDVYQIESESNFIVLKARLY